MPLVTIRLVSGRDTESIRALVERVSVAVSDSLELPLERVTVHVLELAGDRVAKGGKLVGDARAPEGQE
jgi:4-oxalocrotonate tautomerase